MPTIETTAAMLSRDRSKAYAVELNRLRAEDPAAYEAIIAKGRETSDKIRRLAKRWA